MGWRVQSLYAEANKQFGDQLSGKNEKQAGGKRVNVSAWTDTKQSHIVQHFPLAFSEDYEYLKEDTICFVYD